MQREEIFEEIVRMLENRGARKIAIFGSYVKGEEKPESDIGIIVEFSESRSLLDILGIEQELSDVMGI